MSDPTDFSSASLDRYRSYLLLLARLHVESRAANRLEPSDVVEQTLLEAHQRLDQFRGDEAAFVAWLGKALARNMRAALRSLRRAPREFPRDVLERSSAGLASVLADGSSSPNRSTGRHQDLLRFAEAMEKLPEAERRTIELHHLQGWTLAETAVRLEQSTAATAGLLQRALSSLRKTMSKESSP